MQQSRTERSQVGVDGCLCTLAGGGASTSQEQEEVQELRWEPAVKLPSPVAIDSDPALAVSPAALPKPDAQLGKQVRSVVLHCALPLDAGIKLCQPEFFVHLHETSCSVLAEVSPLGLQLMAPPRDARRQAREARKAAPDTAGK